MEPTHRGTRLCRMTAAAMLASCKRSQARIFVEVALAIFLTACVGPAGIVSPPRQNSGQLPRSGSLVDINASSDKFRVKLGMVSSSLYVRDSTVLQTEALASDNSEELRWADSPGTYIRRELGRTLCTLQWVRQVPGATAPTLDIEVIAVDDSPLSAARAVRLQVKARFHKDQQLLFEDTLIVERDVVGQPAHPEDVISAMVDALDAAAEQLTAKVRKALIL